ncbi:MAG: class I SAM-dependent methyltransferase [Actinomycetota bacterium]|nr:class I SAM-dependent methyltransferase [Actinomycetota bacterium]
MTDGLDALLAEQIAYYRARAPEYDLVYAQPRHLPRPDTILAGFDNMFGDGFIAGDVVELACGTGAWTVELSARAAALTAVDAAPEMLALARVRLAGRPVEWVQADLFSWRPARRYDVAFFAFWLSHVPPARFDAFWATVQAALTPGGRAVFVDEGPIRLVAEQPASGPAASAVRRLEDGSEYRIVKVFHDPAELTEELATLGWAADIRPVTRHLFAGTATPA